MFKKILVAHDGSPGAERAFEKALELAAEGDSKVEMVSVIEDLPRYAEETMNDVDEMLERAQKHFVTIQNRAAQQAEAMGVHITGHILPGHRVETIVAMAEQERVDLVVIGGWGHSRLLRRVSGGTGGQIAYHAPCSVLIVR